MNPTPSPYPSGTLPPVPPDWSQFIPDIISAFVVGTTVGIALYLLQRGREARAARRASQWNWRLAGPKLALVMRYAYQPTVHPESVPANIEQFRDVVKEAESMDLVSWSSDDPHNSELATANRLVENSTTLLRLAEELKDLIYIKYKAEIGEEQVSSVHMETASRLAVGAQLPVNLEPLEEQARGILAERELANQLAVYLLWRGKCQADYDALRLSLRAHDGAPRAD